jgi:hypothetical protein
MDGTTSKKKKAFVCFFAHFSPWFPSGQRAQQPRVSRGAAWHDLLAGLSKRPPDLFGVFGLNGFHLFLFFLLLLLLFVQATLGNGLVAVAAGIAAETAADSFGYASVVFFPAKPFFINHTINL